MELALVFPVMVLFVMGIIALRAIWQAWH